MFLDNVIIFTLVLIITKLQTRKRVFQLFSMILRFDCTFVNYSTNKKHSKRVLSWVDPERFELSTFSMPLRRAPERPLGSEPPSRGLTALWEKTKSTHNECFIEWTQRDSNSRPSQCHWDALPTALWAHYSNEFPGALGATAGHLVDLEGFEPSTSSVRLRRAPAALQAPFFRVMEILP